MEDARHLIRQAFDQARASGKPDWRRMTTAVLKNRLLGLTDNSFDEAEYGADTFTRFVLGHDDLVSLDRSKHPPIVELRQVAPEESTSDSSEAPHSRPRIRSDLWQAVVDYSSGTNYVWDSVYGQAKPSLPGEGRQSLPPITQTVHQQWRQEFLDALRTSTDIASEQHSQVDTWVQHQLPTSRLPPHWIPRWNGFFRDKVHQHLLSWFDESGLEPPSDLIITVAERTRAGSSDAETLRRLVLRVVEEMTEHELSQLKLPTRAVLRATRPPRP